MAAVEAINKRKSAKIFFITVSFLEFRGKDNKNVEMLGIRSRRALWSHESDEKLRN